MSDTKICALHGGEVEGFETPSECRAKGYTCPSCAEGDHRNCTRLTCVCVCDDGMSLAMGYLWKQRAETAADRIKDLERERDRERAARERAERLLDDLTPGGSEFYANPVRCAEYVKARLESDQRLTIEAHLARNEAEVKVDALARERDALREALERIAGQRHVGCCPVETGQEAREIARAALAGGRPDEGGEGAS